MPNDPQGPYGARTYATSSKVTTVSDQLSLRMDHKLSEKDQFFCESSARIRSGPLTDPSQTIIDPSFVVGSPTSSGTRPSPIRSARLRSWHGEPRWALPARRPSFPPRTARTRRWNSPTALRVLQHGGGLGACRLRESRADPGESHLTRGKHTVKGGGEVRPNRDTALFGLNPNGQYTFGGGTAYCPLPIRSLSGAHDIQPGQALPDTLSGLLTATPFAYANRRGSADVSAGSAHRRGGDSP